MLLLSLLLPRRMAEAEVCQLALSDFLVKPPLTLIKRHP
jgi:hypothetical protein